MNRLLEIGFEKVGYWEIAGDKISFTLTRMASRENILYAFICDGEVKYIGKTRSQLSTRMSAYRSPGGGQSTNIGNNSRIRAILEAGGAVDIFALPDDGLLHYGRFHLNLAAGLEDDLIRVVDPEWNGGRKDTEETVSSVTGQVRLETERTDSFFPLVLHPTYYRSGFFNVRVSQASLLGGDGETIELHVAARPTPILGMINRTANANETPRIMGGRELRDWFHTTADEGDTIRVNVISPNAVELVPEGES